MVNLLHPVDVVIERLDKTQMVMDEDAREPIHGARSADYQQVTIKAQVTMFAKDQPEMQAGGVRDQSTGYLTVRTLDMNAKGFKLKRGDKITKIGIGPYAQEGLAYFITYEQPLAHYSMGPAMYRFYFSDRHPGQQ